jgi:hypothetical protein
MIKDVDKAMYPLSFILVLENLALSRKIKTAEPKKNVSLFLVQER